MGQVITVSVSQLLPENRNVTTVLRPMVQLISLFSTEQSAYAQVLRAFEPAAFPGVLIAYARLFELITSSMLAWFDGDGQKGLPIELAEAMAAVDRLGSFCFTGQRRVLPSTTFRYLGTMDGIRYNGFPYIDPKKLNMAGQGSMDLANWPGVRNRDVHLLQAATLQFYYGKQVAAGRESEARAHLIIRDTQAVADYVQEIIQSQFIPRCASSSRRGPGYS